jgi:hypothetical protein
MRLKNRTISGDSLRIVPHMVTQIQARKGRLGNPAEAGATNSVHPCWQ